MTDIGNKVLQVVSRVLEELQASGDTAVKRVAEGLVTLQDCTTRIIEKLGVKKASLPRKGKLSGKRRAYERQSWFERLQRWRAGQEATISVLKRRYGLDRLCTVGWTAPGAG